MEGKPAGPRGLAGEINRRHHEELRPGGELTYKNRPETETRANPRTGTDCDHRIKSPSTPGDVLTEG
jgi:hypothetical protein